MATTRLHRTIAHIEAALGYPVIESDHAELRGVIAGLTAVYEATYDASQPEGVQ